MSFLGDCSKQFVRDGNALMDVTALLYLLAFLVGNVAVVEQPRGSTLPLCANLSLVLKFSNARVTSTYGAAFGQASLKPYQLWSNSRRIEQTGSYHFGSCHDGRFTGKKECLQQSEVYAREFGASIVSGCSYQVQQQVGNLALLMGTVPSLPILADGHIVLNLPTQSGKPAV